jgi:hypothetical protein
VLGVLVGIQVANWNEARLGNQRAPGFLERLSGDLDQELIEIDRRIACVGRSIEYGETTPVGWRTARWRKAPQGRPCWRSCRPAGSCPIRRSTRPTS